MVNMKNGDLLKCEEDIICHQVNTFGEMGGGVAYQIKMKYPKASREYEEFCAGKSEEDLIGSVCPVIWNRLRNRFWRLGYGLRHY